MTCRNYIPGPNGDCQRCGEMRAGHAGSVLGESIPVADIEAAIAHIKQNGIELAKWGDKQSVDEGRCRELCAMYLGEFIQSWRLKQKLAKLRK